MRRKWSNKQRFVVHCWKWLLLLTVIQAKKRGVQNIVINLLVMAGG